MALPPLLHDPGLLCVTPASSTCPFFPSSPSCNGIPVTTSPRSSRPQASPQYSVSKPSPQIPHNHTWLHTDKGCSVLTEREFKKIRVNSDLLPGGVPVYDLAEFDTRYYELVQKFGTREELGKGESESRGELSSGEWA